MNKIFIFVCIFFKFPSTWLANSWAHHIIWKCLLRNIDLQSSYPQSSCDVLFYRFTWFLNKKTQNTYRDAWFQIKLNCNDSNENNTKNSSNHWQLHCMTSNLPWNTNKITKKIVKISYDVPSSVRIYAMIILDHSLISVSCWLFSYFNKIL